MDDIKIILWIVIGLIYLFSRRKKSETPPARRPARTVEQEPEHQSIPVPKTFEDLLREIEGSKTPAPSTRIDPPPVVVDYEDNVGEEEQDLEEVGSSTRKEDPIYKVYEDAKAQAFYRPSLEETVKLEDTVVRFKQFKGYEKEPRKTDLHDILLELKDPQGFKKAFVMSEILKPKFRP